MFGDFAHSPLKALACELWPLLIKNMTKVYEASFGQQNIRHVSGVSHVHMAHHPPGIHLHGIHPHPTPPQLGVQPLNGPFTEELNLLILVGPFQLGIFCGSVTHPHRVHPHQDPPTWDPSLQNSPWESNPIIGIKPSRPQWQQSPFIPLLFL